MKVPDGWQPPILELLVFGAPGEDGSGHVDVEAKETGASFQEVDSTVDGEEINIKLCVCS